MIKRSQNVKSSSCTRPPYQQRCWQCSDRVCFGKLLLANLLWAAWGHIKNHRSKEKEFFFTSFSSTAWFSFCAGCVLLYKSLLLLKASIRIPYYVIRITISSALLFWYWPFQTFSFIAQKNSKKSSVFSWEIAVTLAVIKERLPIKLLFYFHTAISAQFRLIMHGIFSFSSFLLNHLHRNNMVISLVMKIPATIWNISWDNYRCTHIHREANTRLKSKRSRLRCYKKR